MLFTCMDLYCLRVLIYVVYIHGFMLFTLDDVAIVLCCVSEPPCLPFHGEAL